METGIKGSKTQIVTDELTAKYIDSGLLPVYGTPYMVALMESTAHNSILPELEEGQGSVGTSMEVKHMAATPVGMEVRCESELVEVDRKRLVFEIKAYDEKEQIGEARHERFIIDNDKFMARAEEKK